MAIAKFETDYKTAMLDHDPQRVAALRLIVNSLKNGAIAKGPGKELTEDDEASILEKMIGARQDSIEQYLKGKATERAALEQYEIDLIYTYLPPQLTEEELKTAIAEAIAENQATSKKQMGLVLKTLKQKHNHCYDGRRASTILTALLP